MNARHPLFKCLAGPVSGLWLAARRGRCVSSPGSLRILHVHETPQRCYPVLTQLFSRLREENGLASPRQAEDLLEGRGASRAAGPARCLLTFDDGFKSNYFMAREVLEPLGARAVFFVCPGLIGLEPAAQRRAIASNIRDGCSALENPALEQELMSWEDIRALASAGHEIGSHSWSHRRLSEATSAELDIEIGTAAQALEDRLGRPAPWFAVPFGTSASINAEALARVAARHRFCRSGIRGLNEQGMSPLGLLSQAIDPETPLNYQLAMATGAFDFHYRGARSEMSGILRAAL